MCIKSILFTPLCLMLLVSFVMADEGKHHDQTDMQAMMEVYTKLATPGPQHKLLASMVGTWTTKTKSWMDPNQPPMESDGSCEHKMLLDGRFLHQECTGDMMGQPFTGIGLNGYDNHTHKYVSTWMDSMGTGIYFFEGTASPDEKTITQLSSYDDPMEGHMKLRAVTKIIGDNSQVFEMFSTGKSGKEAKMMEIIYTRKS